MDKKKKLIFLEKIFSKSQFSTTLTINLSSQIQKKSIPFQEDQNARQETNHILFKRPSNNSVFSADLLESKPHVIKNINANLDNYVTEI